MKKNITKEEEKALLEIAKRLMAAVDSRGDLEARDNDSEDFIEVPVWGIQKAMEEAYLLGRINRQPRQSPTQGLVPRVAKRSEGTDNAPHRGRCGGVGAPGGEAHGRADDGCHRGNLQPHGRQR